MPEPANLESFARFKKLIAHLRSPQGCPWDRKQTHDSLKTTLLEECYEVLQAIELKSPAKLREELGDLLLQIMLNSQIAEEAGEFDIDDVIESIMTKLVRRHPHVFGDVTVKDAEEVSERWEKIKKQERAGDASVLDGVPPGMPALAYAFSLQRRAAGVGFDWKEPADIIEKLDEEVHELKQAQSHEERAREFGDLLFTLVNVARREGIDLEMALRGTNERFRSRFQHMERTARERSQSLDKLSLEELESLWNAAKIAEREPG
ncbi:MAG: nucleoside triphosphate pyrophosphohydrolase [Chloroflexi bacterium]|nr:nucleoside triphosphate pyrophosphohydrolase [Chloroflexota bacterium]